MEIVDLSVEFSERMPKFPASWFPPYTVDEVQSPSASLDRRFTYVHLFAHNGTHVESSDHVVRDGETTDMFALARFAGFPLLVDLRDVPEGTEISRAVLEERLAGFDPAPGRLLLLMTGYDDRHWGEDDFWERSPWLSPDAAAYLASVHPALIGLDFQTEKPRERDFAVHRALISTGAVLCEYLFNLEKVDAATLFLALPIKLVGLEASPVRAVGLKGLAPTT